MEKISREEASRLGLKFYYTGKPCKHGHDSIRIVSNWGCYECSKGRTEKWEEANHEYAKELKRAAYYRKQDYYRKYARDYRRKHRNRYDWLRERRTYWLNRYKTYTGCESCGYNGHPHALDFHHENPTEKTARVSELRTGNLKKLFQEIRKCVVLCANCHRVETYKGFSA
jgi:hypothetical protein